MPRTLLAQSGPSLVTDPENVQVPLEHLGNVIPPVACTFADGDWKLPSVLDCVDPLGDVGKDPQTATVKATRNGTDRRR
jgi:hypothetical protein